MEYQKLVAVTGLPGLFELINSKTDGAIVKSLEDNTTRFASSRNHQFSHLESIEIYTTEDNVNLAEVFVAMDKSAQELPSLKDEKAVKAYFKEVFPSMDFDRVYNSDMKKMVKWFDILKKNNVEIKVRTEEEDGVEEEAVEEAATEAVVEEAPKKAEKAAATVTETTAEEKKEPAKKKAAPKKTEK